MHFLRDVCTCYLVDDHLRSQRLRYQGNSHVRRNVSHRFCLKTCNRGEIIFSFFSVQKQEKLKLAEKLRNAKKPEDVDEAREKIKNLGSCITSKILK
jgi:glutamyl-tRNA reductase